MDSVVLICRDRSRPVPTVDAAFDRHFGACRNPGPMREPELMESGHLHRSGLFQPFFHTRPLWIPACAGMMAICGCGLVRTGTGARCAMVPQGRAYASARFNAASSARENTRVLPYARTAPVGAVRERSLQDHQAGAQASDRHGGLSLRTPGVPRIPAEQSVRLKAQEFLNNSINLDKIG